MWCTFSQPWGLQGVWNIGGSWGNEAGQGNYGEVMKFLMCQTRQFVLNPVYVGKLAKA